ncbi:Peptidase M23 [Fibrella aestuarina BUZ 2]|uniref:Peptidase M23 n=1 Tax=Fibrella aestuarina BUZ 2 TaxID=1166018 RepID=I0K5C8_9BACT|nr:M23 family metallopeptidase [Fibrella aestuarina]CCG99331.1 Peptidase M23 [Fibrella aestuarina BUZ 2]
MYLISLRLLVGGSLLALAAACTTNGPNTGLFRSNTPHEQYERSLKTANLDRTALGLDWVSAGQQALYDSLTISVPYRESGYFGANRPIAVGYRINGSRGDKLILRVEVQGRQAGQVFIDVFSLGSRTPDVVAFAKADTSANAVTELIWEPRRTQTYLIRLQPELLRSGRYTFSVTREPVLSFPVKGRSSRQISSYFGVPRDGGKRRHEGIDIFAPRGTPAVASVNGTISRVGTSNLGGNIVFLSDNERQQRLYYAHLDRFNVAEGQRVSIGDTVGFIGNTGNARTTGPHLHFGVYTFNEGAVDPLPFVRQGSGAARQIPVAPALLGDSVRVATNRGLLRAGPNGDAPIVRELARNQPLTVLGGHADWLRVGLPNGVAGYVAKGSFEAINQPLRTESLPTPRPLLDEAHPQAAILRYLPANATVRVLAQLPNFWLVRTAAGQTGWLLL